MRTGKGNSLVEVHVMQVAGRSALVNPIRVMLKPSLRYKHDVTKMLAERSSAPGEGGGGHTHGRTAPLLAVQQAATAIKANRNNAETGQQQPKPAVAAIDWQQTRWLQTAAAWS